MTIEVLTAENLAWGLDAKPPSFLCGAGELKRAIDVDPYPGYTHNLDIVRGVLDRCMATVALRHAFKLYLLPNEFVGRNNGITYEDSIYEADDGSKLEFEVKCDCGDPTCTIVRKLNGQGHTIVLCGKRIPPMPSMTRYLVAHEFGHCTFNRIRRTNKIGERNERQLEAKYMEARGLPGYETYTGVRRWHQLVSEIVANDFRIVMLGVEPDFWPHDQPHPHDVPAIAMWWEDNIARANAAEY